MFNYPTKRAPYKAPKITQSNRGMVLEEMINITNEIYLERNIAVIYKKPTPVQIVNVDYPKRSMAKISEAYYKTPSTTDYNGLYKGYYIDFDAKQCNSTTSFPLTNVHEHQFRHLERVMNHGGIGFLIIYLTQLSKIFVLPTKNLLEAEKQAKNGGRKSIPVEDFNKIAIEIKESYPIRVPYLEAVDKLIQELEKEKHE